MWSLYLGAAIVVVWGIAHIVPTKAVVRSFGPISPDNRRIIAMEWVAEGLTLIFIGLITLIVGMFTVPGDATALLVFRLCAAALCVLAIWTLIAGFRISVLPIRICPVVLMTAAVLIILGTVGWTR
jgi:hypothetical protein